MSLLIGYLLIALGFSFLCSIAEAVILSVTQGHIAVLEEEGKPSGSLLRKLKQDINSALAAILTLNTIAHTMGAAGVGAQAAVVFGSAYVGVASAILTLLILVFSEIIPKTLGAHYWRELAPATAYALRYLIFLLYPFVKLSDKLTRGLTHGPSLRGFNRGEFVAMAELSAREGQLAQQESQLVQSMLRLREVRVKDAMTPRTVIFSLPAQMTIATLFEEHDNISFSRIPIYEHELEEICGFVLRSDLLQAQGRDQHDKLLRDFRRDLTAVPAGLLLSRVLPEFQKQRSHILLVVDEYGGIDGILTLEDLLETMLGLEIVDESDKTEDMQKLARRLWKHRAKEMGLRIDGKGPKE